MVTSKLLPLLTLLAPLPWAVKAGGGFGGLNHEFLPFLNPAERDSVISAAVGVNASAIRIFIQGLDGSQTMLKGSAVNPQPDPETSLGVFNASLLDAFDDVLASVFKLSGGLTKVIISPHDAHILQGDELPLCDAYCETVNGDWQSFYTDPNLRTAYKNRLSFIFNTYKSKNFNGASWSTLNQVILGVDLQNEPWAGVSPIPSGEDWLCDIATHLDEDIGLGANKILVMSGGISGPNSATGEENWPDPVFTCPAINVVAIHGGFPDINDTNLALTPWIRMLIPGMPLVATAVKYDKRILIESWFFVPENGNVSAKPTDIWQVSEAFIFRGISFLYSSIVSVPVDTCNTCSPTDVNILDQSDGSRNSLNTGLRNVCGFDGESTAAFSWAGFATVCNDQITYPIDQIQREFPDIHCGDAGGRCVGNICSLWHYCEENVVCTNSVCEVCEAGCIGQACPCQRSNVCVNGVCSDCETANLTDVSCLGWNCNANVRCLNDGFCMTGWCLDCVDSPCPITPCVQHTDCSTGQLCSDGACQSCVAGTGCAGDSCTVDGDCLIGVCSNLGVCEYA